MKRGLRSLSASETAVKMAWSFSTFLQPVITRGRSVAAAASFAAGVGAFEMQADELGAFHPGSLLYPVAEALAAGIELRQLGESLGLKGNVGYLDPHGGGIFPGLVEGAQRLRFRAAQRERLLADAQDGLLDGGVVDLGFRSESHS